MLQISHFWPIRSVRVITCAFPNCFPVASPMLPQIPTYGGEARSARLPMAKITKRVVDLLRPDTSGLDVFKWDAGDGALKGFGVRVKPSGAKSYFVQYRNSEGRTRRLVLGRVGELTPEQARELASDRFKQVRLGGDPSAERHAARAGISVAELCDLYLADAKGRIKASTLDMDRSRIE